MSAEHNEVYLGDGVYASFDGYAIRLRAPRLSGDHVIFLEPLEWAALKAYAEKVFEITEEDSSCGQRR
jgi:hypothetical protein